MSVYGFDRQASRRRLLAASREAKHVPASGTQSGLFSRHPGHRRLAHYQCESTLQKTWLTIRLDNVSLIRREVYIICRDRVLHDVVLSHLAYRGFKRILGVQHSGALKSIGTTISFIANQFTVYTKIISARTRERERLRAHL